MKTYTIFVSPLGKTEPVKRGFSWPGFLFPGIWLIIKRLWWPLVGYTFGTGLAYALADEAVIFSVPFLIFLSLLIGFDGNEMYEESLVNRGYELVNTVLAECKEGAWAAHARTNAKPQNS